MKKTISIFALFCSSILSMQAQDESDALRYSQSYFGGTARSSAMGGAFGALGGDFSCLSINPAGIGLYKKSEFTITPYINGTHSTSTYIDNSNSDYRYGLGLNNIGMVFSSKTDKHLQDKGWMNIQFGVGTSKTNLYNSRVYIEGENKKNTIIDAFWNEAQGVSPDKLYNFDNSINSTTSLAYWTYLLDTINSDVINFHSQPQGGVLQTKTITSKGAINEMVFSFGGNYKDKLYIGATIGVPYVKYVERSTYEEFEIIDTLSEFSSLKIQDDITTSGNGLNFKFGLIYRPTDWLRLGGSFHSPTFYNLKNNSITKMTTTFDGIYSNELNGTWKESSPENDFNYTLTSPMRTIGSLGIIFGDKGLISVDYEYVNYPEARLGAENEHFSDENDAIQTNYRSQTNLRLGAEYRLDPITLRIGYADYGSPFHTSINDGSKQSYSFGFGFRDEDYFLDFAYVMSIQSEDYYLYNLAESTSIESLNNHFLCTLGFKF